MLEPEERKALADIRRIHRKRKSDPRQKDWQACAKAAGHGIRDFKKLVAERSGLFNLAVSIRKKRPTMEQAREALRVCMPESLGISPPYTSQPYLTGVLPSHLPSQTPHMTSQKIEAGDLVWTDEHNTKRRTIESHAAGMVAGSVSGEVALDSGAATWLLWTGTHWQPQESPTKAEKLVADTIRTGTDTLGYRPTYLAGVLKLIAVHDYLPPPRAVPGAIPFKNGLLCTDSGKFISATPQNAMRWCLPHSYHPGDDCPTIKEWLLWAVDGDEDTRELLRAAMSALLRGIFLQNFIVLCGPGDTGKSTFASLLVALAGEANMASTDLARLEENQFEPAILYGKRLALISEAGKYGGGVNKLKSLTGGDRLPLERKHVQQTGSFVYDGLVVLTTNEDIRTTDGTSAFERRRVTVRFDRKVSLEQKKDWIKRGGESGVLHTEIPGLINWCLELTVQDIRDRFATLPRRVMRDNMLGMAAGNNVADWLMDNCMPDDKSVSTQVGSKKEMRVDGSVTFENEKEWLYPNYLQWCLRNGRKPVALRTFSKTVVDIARHLNQNVEKITEGGSHKAKISGLRIRKEWESAEDWLAKIGQISRNCEGMGGQISRNDSLEPANDMNVRVNGPKLRSDFSTHTHSENSPESEPPPLADEPGYLDDNETEGGFK